ncbi:MAG: hypothetical protein US12_C0016G0005 [Parcubacteria group bacterium GW2011_GWA2_36_24]|nr:MAG: hypothetical protein US12_C0016G0005 [Parcubacteria group bacterium GW2011_GWA2_36_24]
MNPQQIYWLEELKQADKKLEKFDSNAMELIKFYFLTLFSITTIVFTLYNYQILNTDKSWFFLVFFFPFILGLAVFLALKKIFSQYTVIETTRNQISEWFIHGEIKNEFTISGSIFTAFYTLLSWIVSINLLVSLYFIFPFLRTKGIYSGIIIAILAVAFLGILSSIVLASLNSARKKGRDATRRANIANLRVPLELYYDKHGKYPVTNDFNELLEMLKPYAGMPVNDPLSKDGWSYEYNSEDGKNYTLSYVLEDGGKKSIDSNGEIK